MSADAQRTDDDSPPWGVLLVDEAAVTVETMGWHARRLARALALGDLVLLLGPLGAGKTAFVREVAAGLGVTDPVRSPSFTLANVYAGPVTVHHLDLYRLEGVGESDALALEEYLSPRAVTLVEWPQAGAERLGEAAWVVRLDHETVETRRLVLRARDALVAARWERAAERSS